MENNNPFRLFNLWLEKATTTETGDATAMALATASEDGVPSVRMVLLKDVIDSETDAGGFVFYTNLESRKGEELKDNPNAALCFHWKSLKRQIRIEGRVVPVDEQTADAYFKSRARESKIGAWASRQSRPLESRMAFEKALAKTAARFGVGDIPRPPFWSGFRVIPRRIEFWRDKPFRLHERKVFTRTDDGWHIDHLYP